MKGFQTNIQQECILRRLNRTHIPHQLCRCLGDICSLAKFFCINYTVIGLIRLCQALKLIVVSLPVKIAAVYDTAAYTHGMTVHIFCSRMGDNVCAPLKRTAVNRCRKGIVHNKGNPMSVSQTGKLFQIQHNQCRIGNGFSKHCLCIGTESLFQFLLRRIRIHQSAFNSKPL